MHWRRMRKEVEKEEELGVDWVVLILLIRLPKCISWPTDLVTSDSTRLSRLWLCAVILAGHEFDRFGSEANHEWSKCIIHYHRMAWLICICNCFSSPRIRRNGSRLHVVTLSFSSIQGWDQSWGQYNASLFVATLSFKVHSKKSAVVLTY